MMECYDDPDNVKILLEKTTEFLIKYINAQKAAGSDGVILAEPAAGLLSPALCEEFSSAYVKKIVDAVADDNFIFCYHNCGGSVPSCMDSIADVGADIYHFGNAIRLSDVIGGIPENSVIMGNVDPLIFKDKTPADMRDAVNALFAECSDFDRFMISSGCDIPFSADWQVIDEYFSAIGELYD
jgi:uroporphyrinogen decarboxylase